MGQTLLGKGLVSSKTGSALAYEPAEQKRQALKEAKT